jgi:hypothetical protein
VNVETKTLWLNQAHESSPSQTKADEKEDIGAAGLDERAVGRGVDVHLLKI